MMSTIHEDVEASIYDNDDTIKDMAEAAIAAARPHIRAELFAELIAEAKEHFVNQSGNPVTLIAPLIFIERAAARKDDDHA